MEAANCKTSPATTEEAASSTVQSSSATVEKQPSVAEKQGEDATTVEKVKPATDSSPKKAESSMEASSTSSKPVAMEQGAALSKTATEQKGEKGEEIAPSSGASSTEKSSGIKLHETNQRVNDEGATSELPVTNVKERETSSTKHSSPVAGAASAVPKETKEPANDEIGAETDKAKTRDDPKTVDDARPERPATTQRAGSDSQEPSNSIIQTAGQAALARIKKILDDKAPPDHKKRDAVDSDMSRGEKARPPDLEVSEKSPPKQAPSPTQEKEPASLDSSKAPNSTQDLSQKNSKAAPTKEPKPLPPPQHLSPNAAEYIQELVQRNAKAAFGPLAMQAPGKHRPQQFPQTSPPKLIQHTIHPQRAPQEEPQPDFPQNSPAYIQDLLQKRAHEKHKKQQEQAKPEQRAQKPSRQTDPKIFQDSLQKAHVSSRESRDRLTSQIRASSTLPAASRAKPETKQGQNTWTVKGVKESNAKLPASGMSTMEFLMRSRQAQASRSREPTSGYPPQTVNVDEDDEERRVAAAELESLRGARAASLNSQKQQPRQGSWGGESDDSGLPAAARLLSSWAHQGTSGRKRPYDSSHGAAEHKKRRGGPGGSLVADANVMAQIGQMSPAAMAQRGQAPLTQAAPARASPPAATTSPATEHDKGFLVEQATELVCRALLDGPWPSSTDFSVVVAALHQFSSDIIVPALYAVDPLPTVINDTPIILGTFLMLREALILNADSIFGVLAEEDLRGRRGNQRNSQNDHFSACTLSTSVLLAALDSLDDESSATFTAKFLRLVDAYESGQGDFAQLAAEIDDDDSELEPMAVKWPSGTAMEDDLQDAWRTSYKWHMHSHPSILSQKYGPDVRPMQHNAVHISVIGQEHIEEESTRR